MFEYVRVLTDGGLSDGGCEIDEHGVRSFHTSTTNPHCKHLAPKLKKGEAMPKY